MKHDDLSERLQQHANWLYGIGSPPAPMTPADFLAAGARIDRLQAELDTARAQLLSNERGDDRRHYVCVCPDCVRSFDTVLNEAFIDAYLEDYVFESDAGSHQPSDIDMFVIKDAIMGLLAAAREKKE